jgi:hypothetical protein
MPTIPLMGPIPTPQGGIHPEGSRGSGAPESLRASSTAGDHHSQGIDRGDRGHSSDSAGEESALGGFQEAIQAAVVEHGGDHFHGPKGGSKGQDHSASENARRAGRDGAHHARLTGGSGGVTANNEGGSSVQGPRGGNTSTTAQGLPIPASIAPGSPPPHEVGQLSPEFFGGAWRGEQGTSTPQNVPASGAATPRGHGGGSANPASGHHAQSSTAGSMPRSLDGLLGSDDGRMPEAPRSGDAQRATRTVNEHRLGSGVPSRSQDFLPQPPTRVEGQAAATAPSSNISAVAAGTSPTEPAPTRGQPMAAQTSSGDAPPPSSPSSSLAAGVMTLDAPTSPSSGGSAAPSGEPPSPAASSTRVIDTMHALAGRRGGTVRLRLDPPELGHLTVTMKMNGGTVQVRLEASSGAAATLLEKGLATLRASLQSQGLTVDRLIVTGPLETTNTEAARQDAQERSDDQSGEGGGGSDGQDEPRHHASTHEQISSGAFGTAIASADEAIAHETSRMTP